MHLDVGQAYRMQNRLKRYVISTLYSREISLASLSVTSMILRVTNQIYGDALSDEVLKLLDDV